MKEALKWILSFLIVICGGIIIFVGITIFWKVTLILAAILIITCIAVDVKNGIDNFF